MIKKIEKIIEKVKRKAEKDGWSVTYEHEEDTLTTNFSFAKFTPAGQDFSFSADMIGANFSQLITNIAVYYNEFDVDEQTYIWLDEYGHGKNGAPYRMRDVLEDMEAAQNMIWELRDSLLS